MPSSPAPSLTTRILVALAAGILVGIVLHTTTSPDDAFRLFLVENIFATIGTLFIASLKMMVVPLVLVSLISGVVALSDIGKLGRIGGKTLLFYLFTTAVAITISLTLATAIGAGQGLNLELPAEFAVKERPSLWEILASLIPANPFEAMVEGNMLQIIVFAILLGLGILKAGERAQAVTSFVQSANHVIMEVILIVMKLAPYGVFCLLARTFSNEGYGLIVDLGEHFLTVTLGLLFHVFITYTLLLRYLGKLNPWHFYRKMLPALSFAFSTASSNATIPVTLKTVEEKLGAHNSIASFTIPLGATINMDGTSIMQGAATVFIAGVYGLDLTMVDYLTVILTATLASIGTAGVPGVGLITLAMVLNQVNLPVEGIALIIGIDRLLDMMRTAVNITGDAIATCIVARSENSFDQAVFDARD